MCSILLGKRDLSYMVKIVIKLKILRGRGFPALLEWALNAFTIYPYKKETVILRKTRRGERDGNREQRKMQPQAKEC